MFECVQNGPLKSDWFFSQVPRKSDSGNLHNSEGSDFIRYLLLKLTKLLHRIVNNNVNILQFSDLKPAAMVVWQMIFLTLRVSHFFTGSLSSI